MSILLGGSSRLPRKNKTLKLLSKYWEDFVYIFYALLGCDSGPHPARGGTLEWIDCCSMRYSLSGSEIFTTTYFNFGVVMIQIVVNKQTNEPAPKASKRSSNHVSEQASNRACQQASEIASKLDSQASQPAASKQVSKCKYASMPSQQPKKPSSDPASKGANKQASQPAEYVYIYICTHVFANM